MSTQGMSGSMLGDLARALGGVTDARGADAAITQWLTRLPTLSTPPTVATAPPVGDAQAIGPWSPEERVDGTWLVRRPNADPAGLWAVVDRIAPKQRGRRVVLFGESVARAWGLDPPFNSAGVLRELLQPLDTVAPVDVVDLARSGMMAHVLLATLRAARPLGGDVYIVFAGNNWRIPDPNAIDLNALSRAVRDSGSWRPVAAYLTELVREQVTRIVGDVCGIARDHGAALVFVVPANNVRDWRPDPTWVNPVLSSTERASRASLLAEGQAYLDEQDLEAAQSRFASVVELEEGISPSGLYGLAACALARGDSEAAYRLFERARDAAFVLPVPPAPTCYAVTAEAIRTTAAAAGARVVDLPALFASTSAGGPGRDLFIDNAHMTPKGLVAAMRKVAAEIATAIGAPESIGAEVARGSVTVPPAAASQGHFSGALFAARFGQPRELLRHHCEAAVREHPDIAEVMRLYIDRTVRRASDTVCESFGRLLLWSATFPVLGYLRNRITYSEKRLDVDLLEVLAETVAATTAPEALEELATLARAEHGTGGRVVNLLDRAGLADPVSRVGFNRGHEQHYFTAFGEESAFRLICAESTARIRLCVTTRVRNASAEGQLISLLVNGLLVHSWTATNGWHATTWHATPGTFTDGFNTVSIRWPDIADSRAACIERICRMFAAAPSDRRFDDFVRYYLTAPLPNVYPAYGDIYDFTAATVAPVDDVDAA